MFVLLFISIVIGLFVFVFSIVKFKPWVRVLIATSFLIGTNIWIFWHFSIQPDKIELIRSFHGRMNTNVGWPYEKLMKHLDQLSRKGNLAQVQSEIHLLNENSRSIYDAWLLSSNNDKFKNQIDSITKKKAE